jgi:hypothetical protein
MEHYATTLILFSPMLLAIAFTSASPRRLGHGPPDAASLLDGFGPSCECATPGDLLAVPFLLASGEVINTALHPVELAGGFHRVNGVVVGCSGLYVFQSYAENRIGMTPV